MQCGALGRNIFLLGLIVCAVLSLFLRMRTDIYVRRRTEAVVVSPLSEALSQMVGIAGGIYVAFTLLFGFLEITIPQKVLIAGVSLNPLALCSMLLACVQPVVPAVWHSITGKMHQ